MEEPKLDDRQSQSATAQQRLHKRLKRGGTWVLAGRATCMATVLGIYAFLARVLPNESFAAYLLISSIAVFFSMAAMFGLNTLVCRYVSESFGVGDARRADSATRIAVRLGALSVSLVGLLGWCGAKYLGPSIFDMPLVARSAGLIAIWIMALAVSQIVAEAFRGLHKLRIAGMLGGASGGLAANGLLLLSLVVCRYFVGINLQLVVALTAASLLVPTLIAIAYLHIAWPRETSFVASESDHRLESLSWQSVLDEAIPIMLVQLVGFGVAQLDTWIVAACCSKADFATYKIARHLSLLVTVPLTQIGLVVASSISELHARGDRENLQRILKGAATVGVLAMAVPALALAAFPGSVLTLFGESFQGGATPLRIILLGQLVYVFTGLCGPTLMMTGRQRVPLWALMATLPVLAVAPWAAMYYGLSAVAALFAVSTAIQNLVQWCVVRLMMGIKTHPDLSPRYISQLAVHFQEAITPRTVAVDIAGR